MSEIERCPWCSDPMVIRGDLIQHVDQGSCIIGAYAWPVERLAAWNTRSQSERVSRLEEALKEIADNRWFATEGAIDEIRKIARAAINQGADDGR